MSFVHACQHRLAKLEFPTQHCILTRKLWLDCCWISISSISYVQHSLESQVLKRIKPIYGSTNTKFQYQIEIGLCHSPFHRCQKSLCHSCIDSLWIFNETITSICRCDYVKPKIDKYNTVQHLQSESRVCVYIHFESIKSMICSNVCANHMEMPFHKLRMMALIEALRLSHIRKLCLFSGLSFCISHRSKIKINKKIVLYAHCG